jgi:apolipoprotein N-acyltransferase
MKLWGAAVLSAALLELPFPIAGPMPPWRSIFAWFGLVPLLWAILSPAAFACRHPLRRPFLLSYLCGVLWYMGNCYWVRNTMMKYGDMPFGAPTLLLIGFSLVLGLYFGLFGLGVILVRRATGKTGLALIAAPFLWVALDLAAARITSVPWDQLGYSQVDNALVNQLAPLTGVYGITFVLLWVNAFLVFPFLKTNEEGSILSFFSVKWRWTAIAGIVTYIILYLTIASPILMGPRSTSSATAILIQPNLDVGGDNDWIKPADWEEHIAEVKKLASEQCKTYIAGIPQTGASNGEIICPPYATHADLVVWPESPAPFNDVEPRFQQSMGSLAQSEQAPLIVGGIGTSYHSPAEETVEYFNSAMIFGADGNRVGRYDKIHLVPFGEYVPFAQYLTFARKLTGRVSAFSRGTDRKVFRLNGHHYGVFICYEAVFADEVRHFAQLGADVLVNISDDAWYGDTSAPWQHLNMARMRAIENRRWLLRDTNNGVTASIDPYGRVRQSIPRHQADALPAQYGFRDDITFYTAHGDVFAWLCAILSLGVVGWSFKANLRRVIHEKVRS